MSGVHFGEPHVESGCKGGYTSGEGYDNDRGAGTIRPAGGPRPVPRRADVIYELVYRLCPLLKTLSYIMRNRSR